MSIAELPDALTLSTLTRVDADHNTSLSGLYRSKDGYFTQCEAQGFRRITWFPDRPDVMARYTVTLHADKARLPVLLANGNPVGTDKFAYKIAWMERLQRRAKELLAREEMFVLGGDYNVCPTETDVYDHKAFANDALCQLQSRAALRALLNLGLTDAVRAFDQDGVCYTFWDYQAGAWAKNWGLRIDHLLLSPQAADHLTAAGIDRAERGKVESSDHVPVWCELDLAA